MLASAREPYHSLHAPGTVKTVPYKPRQTLCGTATRVKTIRRGGIYPSRGALR